MRTPRTFIAAKRTQSGPRPPDGLSPARIGALSSRVAVALEARDALPIPAKVAAGLAEPCSLVSGLAFAAYAMVFGLRGLGLDLSSETYLYTPGRVPPNLAVFSHMVLGGLIMLLAPLQLIGRVRARYPRLHRISGRVIVAGIDHHGAWRAGIYRAARHHRGAADGCGVRALRRAVPAGGGAGGAAGAGGGHPRHRAWALRLFVLIMGSLIFRLHYTLWYLLTDGLWSTEALDGPFDRVNYVAFYLPYLVVLEFWLRRRAGAHRAASAG